MKARINELVKEGLRRAGIDILRARPFGIDPLRDIRKIHAGQSLSTIFDVGANEGQTAMEFARKFPEAAIYSFEPFPSTFQVLVERTRKCPRIRPVNIALAERSGSQEFFLTESNLTHSLLPATSQAQTYLEAMVKSAGSLTVQTMTLDAFCEQKEIKQLDLLKLDAQGYELKILEGATKMLAERRLRLVFTEVNFVPLYDKQAYFHDIYQFLLAHHFQMVGLYYPEYRNGPAMSWADALFMRPAALDGP